MAKATIVPHLFYAFPVWWDYTNVEELGRIDQLLVRMKRRGLHHLVPTAEAGASDADGRLLRGIRQK